MWGGRVLIGVNESIIVALTGRVQEAVRDTQPAVAHGAGAAAAAHRLPLSRCRVESCLAAVARRTGWSY